MKQKELFASLSNSIPWGLFSSTNLLFLCFDLYRPANDPLTGNDHQISPQGIPGQEMISMLPQKGLHEKSLDIQNRQNPRL